MFSADDTIVAIATPLGRSGIGVVRISGSAAAGIAAALVGRSRPLQPRRATFARLATTAQFLPQPPSSAGTSVLGRDLRPQQQPPSAQATSVLASDLRPPPQPPLARRSGEVDGCEGGSSAATSVLASDLRPPPQPPLAGRSGQPLDGCEGRSAIVASACRPEPEIRGGLRRPVLGGVSDQVVITLFPGPQSYTGEDVVEISAHGSPVVLQGILHAAMAAGARLAEPGEFTLRAFLRGKLDLVQAEAVADLIDAVTPLQARAAFDQLEGTLTTTIREIESGLFDLMARLEASLDFPDEGYHFVAANAVASEIRVVRERVNLLLAQAARGRLIREGAQVAILGTPNVGKSSLFNALLNTRRAIVTAIPGTTRDLLTERADIRGFSVALVDTAGIRDSADVVEQEGVARAREAAAIADITLLVLDRSRPLGADDRALLSVTSSAHRVVVANKTDLPAAWTPDPAWQAIDVSAMRGAGLDALIDRMATLLGAGEERRDQPLVTNVRHTALLEQSRDALDRALHALTVSASTISEEFILADLQDAAERLQEITGRRTTDDLLPHIFERFCIGK
jgi:tRNA modification GTPase